MNRRLRKIFVEKKKRVGAGGFWKVIDEKQDDSVTEQLTPLSCIAAVGEMLLKSRGFDVNQTEIIDRIGQPASIEVLADFLNEVDKPIRKECWYGIFVNTDVSPLKDALAMINQKGTWGAVMREGKPLGHLVMVNGEDENGLIKIIASFDGTSYTPHGLK
jgi:hypothetical protein